MGMGAYLAQATLLAPSSRGVALFAGCPCPQNGGEVRRSPPVVAAVVARTRSRSALTRRVSVMRSDYGLRPAKRVAESSLIVALVAVAEFNCGAGGGGGEKKYLVPSTWYLEYRDPRFVMWDCSRG